MGIALITGGTGLIGSELIVRLLRADPEATVKVLVRGRDDIEAAVRLDETLRYLLRPEELRGARRRVAALRGDATHERLGLPRAAFDRLAGEVTHIIHSAATTRFDLPLAEAFPVNVEGTRHVLELARCAARAQLQRMVYVSTAYVSGDRNGEIFEDELECGQRFMNSYEETKYLAEREVRSAFGEVPAVVVRPCAVLGDSASGRTRTFNVITGHLASEHGAHFQTMGYSGEAPTLAELLSQAGFHTEVVSRNFMFDGTMPGVTRGFQQNTQPLARLRALHPFALILTLTKPRNRRLMKSTGFFHPRHRESRQFLARYSRELVLTHLLEQMQRLRSQRRPYFLFANRGICAPGLRVDGLE